MRVTSLLVFFLAGAHSFKAVERRAVLMGKGGGGETGRSVVEGAIQAHGLDDNVAVAHKIKAKLDPVDLRPDCAPRTRHRGIALSMPSNGGVRVAAMAYWRRASVPPSGPSDPCSGGRGRPLHSCCVFKQSARIRLARQPLGPRARVFLRSFEKANIIPPNGPLGDICLRA